MKASLIIAVYKDTQALSLILQQLEKQTYKDFEVIVAEDANNPEIAGVIKQFDTLDITHCHQEDLGIRKMRSQNNAIAAAKGELLIFIDGDCLPYPNFIERHVQLAKPGYVTSGRRVNLGPGYSSRIRSGTLEAGQVANHYLKHFFSVAKDGLEGHAESGFSFDPHGWFYRTFFLNSKRTTSLLGCNFSCFTKDIIAINGFDESYGETAIGDDTDIEWRFLAYGLKLQSAKNVANVFHLYHEKRNRHLPDHDRLLGLMRSRKEQGLFFASEGLKEHAAKKELG